MKNTRFLCQEYSTPSVGICFDYIAAYEGGDFCDRKCSIAAAVRERQRRQHHHHRVSLSSVSFHLTSSPLRLPLFFPAEQRRRRLEARVRDGV
ncbi:hypothetical protein PIB30_036243 [Stylosanthes scabra]|uniref:FLZ-type domain-containing protein n=1 Tax=Stylosanthes scabra TaxID=79078 RepID=A0ABU6WBU5_9FABA|nr:hypothetical protein [Stylosanthes scabra]